MNPWLMLRQLHYRCWRLPPKAAAGVRRLIYNAFAHEFRHDPPQRHHLDLQEASPRAPRDPRRLRWPCPGRKSYGGARPGSY